MKILYDDSPQDGNGIPTPESGAPEAGQPGAPNIPPAARTVIEGGITEDTVALKKKLEDTERGKKTAEQRAAQLENENIELRKVPKAVTAREEPTARLTVLDELWD